MAHRLLIFTVASSARLLVSFAIHLPRQCDLFHHRILQAALGSSAIHPPFSVSFIGTSAVRSEGVLRSQL